MTPKLNADGRTGHVQSQKQVWSTLERGSSCGLPWWQAVSIWFRPCHQSRSLFGAGRYLGVVDLIGTMYEDDVVATGFGNYVCLPLLRKAGTDLSKEEAKKVLEDCMRVLFYRNCRSSTRVCSSSYVCFWAPLVWIPFGADSNCIRLISWSGDWRAIWGVNVLGLRRFQAHWVPWNQEVNEAKNVILPRYKGVICTSEIKRRLLAEANSQKEA